MHDWPCMVFCLLSGNLRANHRRSCRCGTCDDLTMSLELKPFPGSFGTEVVGVDLSCERVLSSHWTLADMNSLRHEFDSRHLLFFRGGCMTGEQQVAFVARFGPLLAERNLWSYVSNSRPDGIIREGRLLFHSDFAFTPHPVLGISLHSLEAPASGAPTSFINVERAAKALPVDLRAALEGRSVLNVYDFHLPDDAPMRLENIRPNSPRCERPIFGTHPRTGTEVITASELHSDSIVGMSSKEGRALLRELFDFMYDASNVVEHHWVVGDLLLWDNISLQHGRPEFDLAESRTLQRVTLGQYTPAELVEGLNELLKVSAT